MEGVGGVALHEIPGLGVDFDIERSFSGIGKRRWRLGNGRGAQKFSLP